MCSPVRCKIELSPGVILELQSLVIPPGLLNCNPSPKVCTTLPGSVSNGVSSRLILCVCVCVFVTDPVSFSRGLIERSGPYLWLAYSNYTECHHACLVQPFSIFHIMFSSLVSL